MNFRYKGIKCMTRNNKNGAWSRGALESVKRCPACGSIVRNGRTYTRRDNEGWMPDMWTTVGCRACGSLYLDPRPDARSLPNAYSNYFTHQTEGDAVEKNGPIGMAWSLIHGYINWRFGMRRIPENKIGAILFSAIEPLRLKLDYYGRHLSRSRFSHPGRLLDLGCGNGAFLARSREMGWDVVGCDPDPKAIAICREQALDAIQGNAFSDALDGERFDVVTISHVLEHVADPQALLRRVYELLQPGGLVWVALPNPESLGLRMFGAAWRGLHVPFHLCIPSQKQLRKMVESADFVSIKILRRGLQGPTPRKDSMAIADRENIATPPSFLTGILFIFSDLLATFTPRWAEETIMVAHKPEAGNAL